MTTKEVELLKQAKQNAGADQKPSEIKYEKKNLVERNCEHCSKRVKYTTHRGNTLYGCCSWKCIYEGE